MADLSLNGVQSSAAQSAGGTNTAAKTKKQAKTSLFQAQSEDTQNIKSTETQRENHKTSESES